MTDPNEIKKLQEEIDKLQKRLNVYEGPTEKVSVDEEKQKVRKFFDMFDTDKSGDLDHKEFQQLAFALGETITLDQAKDLIKDIDLDKNGKIDFHEFYTWWKSPDHSFLTQSNKGKDLMILKAKLTSQSYMRTVSRLANKQQEKKKEKEGKEESTSTTTKEEGIATVKAKADIGNMKETACSVDVLYIEDEEDCKSHRQYVGGKSDSIILSLSLTVRDDATDFRLGEMAGALKIVLDVAKKEFLIEKTKIELVKEKDTRFFRVHLVWDKTKDNKDSIEDIQQIIEALHPKSASASVYIDQSPSKQRPDQTLQARGHLDAKLNKSSIELLKEILEIDEEEEWGIVLMLKLLESVKNLDLSFKFDSFHDFYSRIVKENKKLLYGELNFPEGWDFGLNFWANVKPLLLSPIVDIFNDVPDIHIGASILQSYYDALTLFRGIGNARLQMGSLGLIFTAKDLDVVHLFPNRDELIAYDKQKQQKKKFSYSKNKKSLFYEPTEEEKKNEIASVTKTPEKIIEPVKTITKNLWTETGERTLTFGKIGDKNGVIELLRNSPTPPVATPSSVSGSKNSSEFLNPANVHCWTGNFDNSWFMVDLGQGRRLQPNRYTFRYASVGSAVCPRNWKFQGSNSTLDLSPNSPDWVTLHEAKDNRQLEEQKKDFATVSFPISATTDYRFFRIMQTGPNNFKSKPNDAWSKVLVAGGFEAYGKLQLGVKEPLNSAFKFSYANDTNGIINHLVSSQKKPPKVVSSSQDRGREKDFIERGETVHCWTQNKPNSFFLVDFGKGNTVSADHYSWRYGSSIPARATPCCARGWLLQGTNDDNAKSDFRPDSPLWTTLDCQKDNTTLQTAWGTFNAKLDPSKGAFRYFRLIQTEKNASNLSTWCHVFVASGFEIYGNYKSTTQPPKKSDIKKVKTASESSSASIYSDFSSSGSSEFSW